MSARWIRSGCGDSNRRETQTGARLRSGLRWKRLTGYFEMTRAKIALAALAAGLVAAAGVSGQSGGKASGSIEREQLRFPRVRTARQEKDAVVRAMVERKGLAHPPAAMLLRAFKKEGVLELWAAKSTSEPYVLLKSYGICA